MSPTVFQLTLDALVFPSTFTLTSVGLTNFEQGSMLLCDSNPPIPVSSGFSLSGQDETCQSCGIVSRMDPSETFATGGTHYVNVYVYPETAADKAELAGIKFMYVGTLTPLP